MVDIEDLVKFGQNHTCCPYYLAREIQADAEIVFMPYNYLLDPVIRKNNKIQLEGSIIIFDEAHNIENICEEVSSITFSASLLASAINELKYLGEKLSNEGESLKEFLKIKVDEELEQENVDDETNQEMFQLERFKNKNKQDREPVSLSISELVALKGKLVDLEDKIMALEISDKFGFSRKGNDITPVTAIRIETTLENLSEFISSSDDLSTKKWRGIESLKRFIQVVFHISEPDTVDDITSYNEKEAYEITDKYFRVHFKDEPIAKETTTRSPWTSFQNQGKTNTTDRTILFCCLYPGKAMKNLYAQNVRSIILTSGTLYPIDSLKLELGLDFPITLQNGHVVNHDQVKLMVITKGPDGKALNSSYQTRSSNDYLHSMGLTILNIVKEVPRGVLVFFPSYDLMNKCMENWKQSGTYDKIIQFKKIFPEPKDKQQFNNLIFEYKKCCIDPSDTRGGLLIAVMRGRASEGLDMSDHTSRAVLVLGLPYPPLYDPKIKMKMSYLDEMTSDAKKNFKLPGGQWYKMQAWKAINQAIGRVIRHRNDFGCVLLCDERFASNESRHHLPAWIKTSFEVFPTFDKAPQRIQEFFFSAEKTYPPPPLGLLPITEQTQKSTAQNKTSSIRLKISEKSVNPIDEDSLKTSNSEILSLYTSSHSEGGGHKDVVDSRSFNNNLFDAMNKKTLDNKFTNRTAHSNNNRNQFQSQMSISEMFSSNRSGSQGDDNGEEEGRSCKRLKLQEEKSNPLADNKPLNDYFLRVKETLKEAKQEQAKEALRKFTNSLKEFWGNYKFFKDDPDKVSSLTVQLFSGLSEVFFEIEQPGLLSELVQFLPTKTVQEHFDKMLHDLTGLSGLSSLPKPLVSNGLDNISFLQDKENLRACVKCFIGVSRVPLVAPCKHVACFECWKAIFQTDSKVCPKCFEPLKKRDLKRLVDSSSCKSV